MKTELDLLREKLGAQVIIGLSSTPAPWAAQHTFAAAPTVPAPGTPEYSRRVEELEQRCKELERELQLLPGRLMAAIKPGASTLSADVASASPTISNAEV